LLALTTAVTRTLSFPYTTLSRSCHGGGPESRCESLAGGRRLRARSASLPTIQDGINGSGPIQGTGYRHTAGLEAAEVAADDAFERTESDSGRAARSSTGKFLDDHGCGVCGRPIRRAGNSKHDVIAAGRRK